MRQIKFIFVLVILSLLQKQGHGQLSERLDAVFEEYGLMGLSLITMCEGEIQDVYLKGLKDYTRNLEIDNSTMFRSASISKLVTSSGMMILLDEGVFNLDDDISTALGYQVRNPYWPDIPITYRMVLSQTSSIQDGPSYMAMLIDSEAQMGSPPSMEEILIPGGAYYGDDVWALTAPGSMFNYSNLNYAVVGTLIEALTQTRFDIYMKERLLNKLNIAGSFNVRDIENINDLAALYEYQDGWKAQFDNYQGIAPEPIDWSNYITGTNALQFTPHGGFRVSPMDLTKIMQLHLSNGQWMGEQIISESTIQLMRSDIWKNNGFNGETAFGLFQAYGLGVHHITNSEFGDTVFPDREMFGHKGANYGLFSGFFYDTIDGSGVIFITNGVSRGLDFGQYSAFLTLEESIFQAVFDNLGC